MIEQITPADLKRMLDAGDAVYLVDVRNYDEHAYCKLPDSMLVPLPELPGRVDEVQPEKDAMVVVYCHHGVRSLSGAAILQRAGFEKIASLRGGIDRLVSDDRPLRSKILSCRNLSDPVHPFSENRREH